MKIAAYIRVSNERQDEYSPESQIKIIRYWASKNGSPSRRNMFITMTASPENRLKKESSSTE